MDADPIEDIRNFHWDPKKLGPPQPKPKRSKGIYWHYMNKRNESWQHRIKRMLMSMHSTVQNCTMCPLGRSMCNERYTIFDPHVFSNMVPSKWMIVGQNPGFNECMEHKPFVGDAGKYFDRQLLRFGLKRDDFYISNVVKCHTENNNKPDSEHMRACEPILRMELMLLKPKLVITLGAVAFDVFCPELQLSDSFGKIHKSKKFGVKVYPIYHPSPRNINIQERRERFENDLRMLCKVIRAHRRKNA